MQMRSKHYTNHTEKYHGCYNMWSDRTEAINFGIEGERILALQEIQSFHDHELYQYINVSLEY